MRYQFFWSSPPGLNQFYNHITMSPTEIHYISTNTVRPKNPTSLTPRIELTPWDLRILGMNYIERGLLFNSQTLAKAKQPTLINHLITSLSHTLDYFFPLAGRLGVETHEDNTTTVFIVCNMQGAEFIHASVNLTIKDILRPVYVPKIVHSFFPLNDVINYQGTSKPLLAVQVTELVDGIFIGCSMNHAIADGTSFWQFIKSWSEISRTSNFTISCPPILQRWFLNNAEDCPVRLPCIDEDQFTKGCVGSLTKPLLLERFFNFTPQSIAKLKAKANSEQGTTKMISSLQALLGHVWIAATRAKGLDYHHEIRYVIVAGNRARLNPQLPEEYFGNSVQAIMATAKVGDLLEKGLGWVGSLLHEAVASHDDMAIRSFWKNWMKNPRLLLPNYDPNAFVSGSSPRFDLYGNDFGWGCPVAVRTGFSAKFDGMVAVYPGATEGSVDIETVLSPKTLMAMAEDTEFMETVTIHNANH